MQDGFSTFTSDLGNCIIIVKNVPSKVCGQCGEVSYTGEVARRAGFGEDNESTLSFSYESELYGGVASLGFSPETLRILDGEIGDIFGDGPLSIDELYAWVKPFGPNFKFTGGLFENTDGIADYTDDIDIYGMGVFIYGEGGPFSEPESVTNTALSNGFLTDAIFGPVTVQFLLAPNYNKKSASAFVNNLLIDPMNAAAGAVVFQPVDADKRFFRLGGRVSADIGVGTVSALFKTFQWPMELINAAQLLEGAMGTYPGSLLNFMSFGAYADITAIENLGISVGYTGYIPLIDDSDYESVLYSGIDLRATWTGISGLSLSTHNNISFATGVKDDWLGILGDGDSFLTLFNAVGATKELTEKFSVNGEIANVFSKTDRSNSSSALGEIEHEGFKAGVKLIAKATENAEFKVGLKVNVEKNKDEDTATVFSVPIGITVSF
jgi:YgiT-type zinc finger domain-containing protein